MELRLHAWLQERPGAAQGDGPLRFNRAEQPRLLRVLRAVAGVLDEAGVAWALIGGVGRLGQRGKALDAEFCRWVVP